jgi:hypothetical protein
VFEMDASDFNVHCGIVGPSLMRTIKDQLLQNEMEDEYIRAEPSRLHIYGKYSREVTPYRLLSNFRTHIDKDSFLGAHKDNPRGTDILGSLVVIYPTPHNGGELVLRHEGREWKSDAGVLTASQTSPSLAYVAFRSNVEHEVLKVKTGHRVTVTYNLYLVDPLKGHGVPPVTRNVQNVSNLQTTLQRLLKEPEFLSGGGTLGFGLVHHYPRLALHTDLQEMESFLKGADAHVYRACQELQLQPALRVIYEDDRSGRDRGCHNGIMLDEIFRDIYDDSICESFGDLLVEEMSGVLVNEGEEEEEEDYLYGPRERINWISPFNERNRVDHTISTYTVHCSPCMIARVAAAYDRV